MSVAGSEVELPRARLLMTMKNPWVLEYRQRLAPGAGKMFASRAKVWRGAGAPGLA